MIEYMVLCITVHANVMFDFCCQTITQWVILLIQTRILETKILQFFKMTPMYIQYRGSKLD